MIAGLAAIDLALLQKGLKVLGIEASHEAAFVEYFNLLQKWNRLYNLTAISDPHAVIVRHFFDSLSVRKYLRGKNIIDVGTGAGFPGVPLAIVEPSRQFVLVDSQIKKIRFLEAVKRALALSNVEIIHGRVEDISPTLLFDTVLARAFGPLAIIFEKTRHLVRPGGQILAMKGRYPSEELSVFDSGDFEVHRLDVPSLEQQRHLVRFTVKAYKHE